jgi:hypothetical protein
MGIDDFIEKGIAETIQKLKSETDPKKIEKFRKVLKRMGLSEEEIETRLESPEIAPEVPSAPRDKGYKKGNLNSGDQMYILACTHQIRAKKQVGIFSKGMIGKTVWCDVCSAERVVTSMPYWVR